jgi:hypothetical protein
MRVHAQRKTGRVRMHISGERWVNVTVQSMSARAPMVKEVALASRGAIW